MAHTIKVSKDLSEIILKITNLDELLSKALVQLNTNGKYLISPGYMNEILFYVQDIESSSKKLEDEEMIIFKYLISDISNKLEDLCSYIESKGKIIYTTPDYSSLLSVCKSIKSVIYKFK